MGKMGEEQMRNRAKTKRTTVKMPEDLYSKVQDIADRKGQPVNTIMNALLWEALGGRFTAVK